MLRMMKLKKLKERSMLLKTQISGRYLIVVLFLFVLFCGLRPGFQAPFCHFCLCYLTLCATVVSLFWLAAYLFHIMAKKGSNVYVL